MTSPRAIIVANDVVPGMGLPVAAPGLRAHGLSIGLAEHEIESEIVLPRGPVDSLWPDAMPPPAVPGVTLVRRDSLTDYLRSRAPAVVLLTNSNHVDHVPDDPELRYVFDFFAPKMLETAHKYSDGYPAKELAALRSRKLRGLNLADAVIVNGAKKVGYVMAWLVQTEHDIRNMPLAVVPMAVPSRFREREVEFPLRTIMGGYLQGWNVPGGWLQQLLPFLEKNLIELHAFRSPHWGQHDGAIDTSDLEEILSVSGVVAHETQLFSDYQDLLSTMHITLDVFPRTREREYAMVTRAIVSLACGVPVVHPSFTEVSPLIDDFDAGWLIESPSSVTEVLQSIVDDPDQVKKKAAGAQELWRQHIRPARAVRPLVPIIRSLARSIQ